MTPKTDMDIETLRHASRIWDVCRACASAIYGRVAPSPQYAERIAHLLFGTAAQESGLRWERQRSPRWGGQVGGFSKWQVEIGSITASLDYLRMRPDVCERATLWLFDDPHAPADWPDVMPTDAIMWALRLDDNDKIGAMFGRLHYLRIAEPVPDSLAGQAQYWKRHYNTEAGAGTVSQYIRSWAALCEDVTKWE